MSDMDQLVRSTYLPEDGERPLWEIGQEEDRDFDQEIGHAQATDSAAAATAATTSSSSSWMGGFSKSYLGDFLTSITGNKVLDAQDLEPVMTKMKDSLQAKNVAHEIADRLVGMCV